MAQRSRLGAQLLRAAQSLSEGVPQQPAEPGARRAGADAGPLLELQEGCDATLQGPCDALTVLVAFTLSSFVADAFRNLFVDTQFSPSLEKGRIELLERSASSLESLAGALEAGNRVALAETLGDLIQFYALLLGRLRDLEEAQYGYR